MIEINQLRLTATQPRVAQPNRYARVERLGFVSNHAR
jgi:hypothetical protein